MQCNYKLLVRFVEESAWFCIDWIFSHISLRPSPFSKARARVHLKPFSWSELFNASYCLYVLQVYLIVPDKEVLFLFVKEGVCSQPCPQNLRIFIAMKAKMIKAVPDCGLDSIAISLFGNITGKNMRNTTDGEIHKNDTKWIVLV